jgi:surface antigen
MFFSLLGAQAPTQQETLSLITEKKPAIVQVVEPTLEEKIASNYYKCNEAVEWIRADNAQCLPKQPVVAQTTQKAVETPVRASGGHNDMDYGYCTWHVKNLRPDLPRGLGNANTWYSRAQAFGLAVGSTPRVGAVATTTRGSLGHVSLVTQIEGDRILVSEMNVQGRGVVSSAWYSASDYRYIY